MYFGEDNSVDRLVDNAMEKLRGLIDSSTVIGDVIETPYGTTIIPISRVSVGYVVGGGEYSDHSRRKKDKYPLAGGSGGGMSITPVGFLVETAGKLKYIDVENKSAYQTVLNMVNTILGKIKGDDNGEKE